MLAETAKQAAERLVAPIVAKGYVFEGIYTYLAADGSPYYRIRAKHPGTGDKWVRPMYANGNGYVLAEPKCSGPKPLYRADEVRNPRPDVPVFVVEGEPKVEALRKLGIVAVTSGGASSASGADWSPLAGCTVVIWPDNDAAGKRFADEVSKILNTLDCDVSVINVAALNLGDGGDVVDYLAALPEATSRDILALPKESGDATGWGEPQPLVAVYPRVPYPVEALPDLLRRAVEEVQGFVQAPPSLVATSALSAVSLAAQGYANVRRADKLTGPISTFSLVIGASGERKTTVDGFFRAEVERFERDRAAAMAPEVLAYAAELDTWKVRREAILGDIKKNAKQRINSDALEGELREHELGKPPAPKVPRFVLADETPENLAHTLATKWPVAGVMTAEAGVVLGSHAMGTDSIKRHLGLLNLLWDGGSLSIGRRTTESFTVRGVRLTIGLQVQPEVFASFFNATRDVGRGSGFFARFLIAEPESTQGTRKWKDPPKSWPALDAFHRRIREFLEQPLPIDDRGELNPPALELSEHAMARWVGIHDGIERELGVGGDLQDVRDVASKAGDNIARVAALFHVLEHGIAGQIGEGDVVRAAKIVLWHLNEARRFFGWAALPRELSDAARLEQWLLDRCRLGRTDTIPIAKVQQFGPGELRKKSAIDAAMRELDWLDRARMVQQGKRRFIHVNPALLDGSSR